MIRTTRLIVAAAFVGLVVATLLASAPARADVSVHGFMLNRAYADPSPVRFEAERVGLSVDSSLNEDICAHIEFYYHPWLPDNRVDSVTSTQTDYDDNPITYTTSTTYNRLWLEGAYADFTDADGGRLRVGKSRNFCFGVTPTYGNRKTTEYGLISETVTMERIVGVQYNRSDDGWDWGAALYNGLALSARLSGGDANYFRFPDEAVAIPHFADKGENANLEGSFRIGRTFEPGVNAGFSYRQGKITRDELSGTIQGTFGLSDASSRTKRRYGLDVTYKAPSGGMAQIEWYKGRTSDLDHKAWCVLVGHEPPDNPMDPRFYVRYGKLDLDVDPMGHPLTWDQKQLMVSVVKPLGKAVWVQFEYIKNSEDPPSGVSTVENDMLFAELFNAW